MIPVLSDVDQKGKSCVTPKLTRDSLYVSLQLYHLRKCQINEEDFFFFVVVTWVYDVYVE